MKPYTGLSHSGGRHSGGGGGIAEAPRSVKSIDMCKILDDLCKKIGAEIVHHTRIKLHVSSVKEKKFRLPKTELLNLVLTFPFHRYFTPNHFNNDFISFFQFTAYDFLA